MPIRDIIVVTTVFTALPYCFTRPFFGLLVFSWLAYMRPQDICWSFAKSLHFSMPVALLMFSGFFFFEKRPFTRSFRSGKWILALGLWVSMSMFLNLTHPGVQMPKWLDLIKVFVIAFFTAGMVDDKKRLDLLIWTIALSLGFYGIKGGLFGILTGGRILQGPGGMMKDNNDFCLAMNMNLPILYYLAYTVKQRRVRQFLFAACALTIVAIIITTSRGGFLTMAGVIGLFILKSNKKFIGISSCFAAVILFIIFMPADVRERLATLGNVREDGSASGRLHAWNVAYNMFKAKPVLGVGFQAFTFNFRKYDPTPQELWQEGKKERSVRVAHNSYLQVLAESGAPALIFFLAMLISSVLLMRRLRRINKARDGPLWITNYTHLIEVSLAAFCAGAMFLNRSHFDLLYHLIAISGCIYYVGMRVLKGIEPDEDGSRVSEPPRLEAVPSDPFLVGTR